MTSRKPIDDARHQQTVVSSLATKTGIANRPWVLALVLAVLTFAAYQPTWHAGFVWDDDELITENRMIQARDGLQRIWLTTEAPDYYPLTWSFWWLQWRVWGKNPAGWHAVNVLLHAANVVLVWIVLRRLRIPGAWLAALLFAVHPVNVATVAQINEQKNTLSMLWYAVAILLYLQFDETNDRRWYGFSLGAFLLALLSKSAVVMLPVVLLGCVWWLRGRLRSKDWLRTAPFFVLSLLLGVTTVWFQYHRALNGQGGRTSGLLSCLMVAGLAPWFYLSKAVLPLDLCLIYPRWNPRAWGWSGWLPGIALAGTVALLWRKRHGWGRPLLFGLGYFVVMLFPVLGFFNQGFYRYSLVADHWQYYSLVGVAALAAAGAVALGSRLPRGQQRVAGPVAGVVVIVLGALSWQRCLVYRNQETLFRDNLLHNPLAWVAHYNLGLALANTGRLPEAMSHYEQALRIKPDIAEARYNLGIALAQVGRLPEAMSQYEQALRLRPDYADVHCNLGNAFLQEGKLGDAIGHYEQALRIKPDFAEAHNDLGIALAQVGRLPEAMSHYEQALRLRPNYADAHFNLGIALGRSGRTEDAIAHFEQALRIKPDYAKAHHALGLALEQVGKVQEAIGHFEQALRVVPDYVMAQNNLAWLLATLAPAEGGDPVRAVSLAERACQLTNHRVAPYLDTLAAAYAAAGRFTNAVTTAQAAIELARSSGQTQVVTEIQQHLQLYRSGRAYRPSTGVTSPSNP